MHRAGELGAGRASALLQQVDEINMGQRERVVELAVRMCGGSVLNHRVGVLGAAFKPHTDDVRDSPALNVAAALHLRGAQVTVYDPEAGDTARATFPTLGYVGSMEEAVEGSDVVLLLTEWDEFLRAEPARLAALTHAPRVIDARGRLDPARWREAGWLFQGLGRMAA
jgi:UDPglucose 6-dehydrogenase